VLVIKAPASVLIEICADAGNAGDGPTGKNYRKNNLNNAVNIKILRY
jgi:hypothetical protein